MSKEFFEAMEEISKSATKIKFLEGSYPAIYNKYFSDAERIKKEIIYMEESIIKELKKKAKPLKTKVKKNANNATAP